MKFAKRIISALSAGMLIFSLASCSNSDESSVDSNIEEAAKRIGMSNDSMPYGASITQILPKVDDRVKIGIEYDNRFMTADEAIALSHYVEALSNCDGELLSKTYYKTRLDAILEFAGEPDASKYLEGVYENIRKNYIEDKFEFNYIITEDCFDESYSDEDTGFSAMDKLLTDAEGEEILDKITSRKLVQYDVQYAVESAPENRYMLSYRTNNSSRMYLYTIDGTVYVL